MIPEGIVATGWPEVEAQCAEFGDEFDAWQQGFGSLVLAKRENGEYAATIGGVTITIPRQVAKTFIVARIVFALCVLFPGLKVLWTAHRTRTSTQTFKNMMGYTRRAKVAPHVADIRRTNGEQEILFANGSIIMFGARETGFGRGFEEVDIEVFDEAQILTEKALDDMVAATNQSRHPHGALLFFMGTPPKPTDPGEAFTSRRADALSHREPEAAFGPPVVGDDHLFIECSADSDADPDDHAQWAKANPSFPFRTPLRSMLRLRKNLVSDESWRREALGIWDAEQEASHPINLNWWSNATDLESVPVEGTERLCIDAPPLAGSAVFALAGLRDDGLAHVSRRHTVPPVDPTGARRSLKDRVLEAAEELTKGHDTPLIVPSNSPARAWLADLEEAGIKIDEMKATDYSAGCVGMVSRVADGTIKHRGQADMNEAVAGLAVRSSGDVDVWSRRKASVNIAPFVAATCALARVPEKAGQNAPFVVVA